VEAAVSRSRVVVAALGLCLTTSHASAQFAVVDPATTVKQSITAGLKELAIKVDQKITAATAEMAKRINQYRDLKDYAIDQTFGRVVRLIDGPLARLAVPLGYAGVFMDALNTGKRVASDIDRLYIDPRDPVGSVLAGSIRSIDIADSVLESGVDTVGRIHQLETGEYARLARLDADVNGAHASTTAVLQTISAAGLIRARQQQTRTELSMALVETLLMENLREREADAAMNRMRIVALNYAADDGGEGGAQGVRFGDLAGWRQP
jgi:hypothetical protein